MMFFCFFCTEIDEDEKKFYPFVSETLCQFLICKKCAKEFIEGFEEWLEDE